MRVLSWLGTFWPTIGGVEVRVAQLIPSLMARGHRIAVVAEHNDPRLPREEERDGFTIHRFPFQQALRSRDVDLFAEALGGVADLRRRFPCDLVHLHDVWPNALFFLRTAHVNPAPMLLSLPRELGAAEDVGPESLLGRMLRQADWFTSCSEATLQAARDRVPELAGRSSVVPSGIPVLPIEPGPPRARPPHLVGIGRLVEGKAFDRAIEALAALVPDFPGAHLTLAGDGPMRGPLARQAEALGLRDAVRFTGAIGRDDVWALLKDATVLVAPTRTEGMPLVVLEAMAMARPVVAARVGGIPEAVAHGRTGLLVDVDDRAALVDALRQVLADPARAEALGREGRRRLETGFDWDKHVVAGYDALYRRLGLRGRDRAEP